MKKHIDRLEQYYQVNTGYIKEVHRSRACFSFCKWKCEWKIYHATWKRDGSKVEGPNCPNNSHLKNNCNTELQKYPSSSWARKIRACGDDAKAKVNTMMSTFKRHNEQLSKFRSSLGPALKIIDKEQKEKEQKAR